MNTVTHPLIILGSGPAGLTAGIYAARAFLKPLIFQGDTPGGQLMGTTYVENWPGIQRILGPDLMIAMEEQVKSVGGTLITETITSVDLSKKPFVITSNKNTYQTHSLIIATGASPNKLGCPGEQEYWGRGVGTCAICDGAFYPNKKIIIVGGGDTAMETASFMAKYTKDITIVHILDTFTASPIMQQRVQALSPAPRILYGHTVVEIKGNGQSITNVTVEHQTTKERTELPADALFLAIGSKPNTSLFKEQLPLDSHGLIITEPRSNSPKPGVFIAGDVADFKYKQAVVSAGAGCMAALEAQRYLEHNQLI